MMLPLAIIHISDTGCFLDKYIRRQLEETPLGEKQRFTDNPDEAQYRFAASEHRVEVTAPGTTAAILLPEVIGTGMTGLPRRMAAKIWRGSYFNIGDDQSRLSVVHAVDVARAATIAASRSLSGEYRLTDGANPTYCDLAAALSYRMGNKRIYALSDKWARRIARWGDHLPFLPLDSEWLRTITTDRLVDDSAWREAVPDWHPTVVTNYLTTHDYDSSSL